MELKFIPGQMTHIIENITDGIVIYDPEWCITFVNQQGAQIIGKAPEELIGKNVWNLYPDAFDSDCYQEFHRAVAQQVSVHFQEFYMSLNRWLEIHAYPAPEGLIVLYQDITSQKQVEEAWQTAYGKLEKRLLERTLKLSQADTLLKMQTAARQRAEQALRTTNEQLASIFERITDGFCAVDREWRYTYVNQKAEEILQKNQTELLGRNMWEVFPPAHHSTVYFHYHQALKTGIPVRFEAFCPGVERWFEISAYPSHDGLSIYLQDISDRKRIEAERQQLLAREQETRAKAELAEQRCTFLSQVSEVLASSLDYQTTFQTVARLVVPFLGDYCLIHQLNPEGQLRMVAAVHHDPQKQALIEELAHLELTHIQDPNSFTAQVLRIGEPMLVSGAPPRMSHAVAQNPRLSELYAQLNPKSVVILPLIARKQILGSLVLARAESDPCYGESDLSVLLDLARRTATALDNAQLYHIAQESNLLKEEFLLTLSHELRTPLNAILGWANMLLTRSLNERMIRQAIETIERKARAQVQMIYDLLNVSRLVTGKLRLNPSGVELNTIIQEAIDSLEVAIEAKSIQVTLEIDSSVALVRGDPKYLQQVVWNLLSNAIKFTDEGGQVKIQLKRVDHYAQMQVSDTGIGIPTDFLPYVFDRFRQADGSTTRSYQGLGLGLTLVRQLVELHGGTIQAWSEGEGKGATFTVKLPLLLDTKELGVRSKNTAKRSRLAGLKLLIVDDEPDSREAIASQLVEYGADTTLAASVKEALEVLRHLKPDLLIRSSHLLESDSYWLLSTMRNLSVEEGGQIPVIALSTDTHEQEATSAQAAGIQMHIPQPIKAGELAALVATLAGRNRSV
jgi:PAS domain S-box-containing protein